MADSHLAQAGGDSQRIQSFFAQDNLTPIAAAIDKQDLETLECLLTSGTSPNLWPGPDAQGTVNITSNRTTQDPAPVFDRHRSEETWQYPLYQAAIVRVPQAEDHELHARMIKALFSHGADMFTIFRQPLIAEGQDSRWAFPGKGVSDLTWTAENIAAADEQADLDYQLMAGHGNTEPPWPKREAGEPELQPDFGLRSLIHAVLEDGLFAKPIITHPHLYLDLERRDPQGRTLLLSACRSSLGADAIMNGSFTDISWNPNTGWYHRNPFPLVHHPTIPDTPASQTALQYLISRGADPLATDAQGKSAIHHLLEAHDSEPGSTYGRPAVIRQSLSHFISTCPSLVNRPDSHGTYPLHAALRRLRRYRDRDIYATHGEVEECVVDLLASGADPNARDGRGNTALHYLLDGEVSQIWAGETTRETLDSLLDGGMDINMRNNEGHSALWMLLNDDGRYGEERARRYEPDRDAAADDEPLLVDCLVFGSLDNKGADWRQVDEKGRSLLHLVAAHRSERANWRCGFLLWHGVDSGLTDRDGITAMGVAAAVGNRAVVECLERFVSNSRHNPVGFPPASTA